MKTGSNVKNKLSTGELMKKRDIVNIIYKQALHEHGRKRTDLFKTIFTESLVEGIIDKLFELIKDELIRNNYFRFKGFGSFKISILKPRTCRNPKTGEEVKVGERERVRFKPSKNILKY